MDAAESCVWGFAFKKKQSASHTHNIAMVPADLHAMHTLLEVHPVLFLGITAACIPFLRTEMCVCVCALITHLWAPNAISHHEMLDYGAIVVCA